MSDRLWLLICDPDDDDLYDDDYNNDENFDWVDWIDNLKCQSEHIM